MNKTELDTLGAIVADLLYARRPRPDARAKDAGKRILAAFPSLQPAVTEHRVKMGEGFVVYHIHYIMYRQQRDTPRAMELHLATKEKVQEIFSDYYWLSDVGNEPDILKLAAELDDCVHDRWPILAPVLTSQAWTKAVRVHYPRGTDEYRYLTEFAKPETNHES